MTMVYGIVTAALGAVLAIVSARTLAAAPQPFASPHEAVASDSVVEKAV
jgi:hypothetical protein